MRVTVTLNKATRIDGEHREIGDVVEVEGRHPKTGELEGDARYLIGRGMATLVEDGESEPAGNGRGRGRGKGAEG